MASEVNIEEEKKDWRVCFESFGAFLPALYLSFEEERSKTVIQDARVDSRK